MKVEAHVEAAVATGAARAVQLHPSPRAVVVAFVGQLESSLSREFSYVNQETNFIKRFRLSLPARPSSRREVTLSFDSKTSTTFSSIVSRPTM